MGFANSSVVIVPVIVSPVCNVLFWMLIIGDAVVRVIENKIKTDNKIPLFFMLNIEKSD